VVDGTRSFHLEYIHHLPFSTDETRKLKIGLDRGVTFDNLMYSGNITNTKQLDDLTLSFEMQKKMGKCKTEKYGVRITYLWTNAVYAYGAAKISYYGGYGNKEFCIPLYFDFPPDYVLMPEVAAGFVIGPILAFSFYKYVKKIFLNNNDKIELESGERKNIEVVNRKKITNDEFKVLSANINEKYDVTVPLRIITKNNLKIR
jgi:hypothetical protein